MTLRKPPKPPHATTNLVGRMVGLVVLLALFGVVVWVTTTNNQIPLIERSNPLIGAPGSHMEVRGLSVHVRSLGPADGEAVVLIHDDSVAGGATLTRLANELADRGYRVLVPDLIGFGFSSKPTTPGRVYTVTGQTEMLAEVVAALEVGPGLVAGFGWGGAIAAELAVTDPEAVLALALVNTSELPPEATGWESIEALPWGVGRAVSFTRHGASDGSFQAFFEGCGVGGWCNDEEVTEGFRRATTAPGTAESVRARRASGRASVAGSRLGEVDVPVVLVGTTAVSAGELRELASGFGAAEVRTLPGGGDHPQLSTPAQVADLIIP